MKTYGYARISTDKGQKDDAQIDLLLGAGVRFDDIYRDVGSGKNMNRARLEKVLSCLQKDDVLVVTELSRLARSVRDLHTILGRIEAAGAKFKCLRGDIDTGSPTGRLMFNLLGSIAQFEREITLERQREGIRLAKQAGAYKGRKRKLDSGAAQRLVKLRRENNVTIPELAKMFGISRATVYQYLKG